MPSQGLLFAFEGIDGSGKSTQRSFLAEWLTVRQIPNLAVAQPSDSMAGRILRLLAKAGKRLDPSQELALFLRDRREQARSVIKPALNDGISVLLDRHFLSSIAYQGALGLDPSGIHAACLRFSPIPDATFLVDIEPSVSLQRIRRSRSVDAFEKDAYLRRVRAIYLEWAARLPDTHILDGNQPPERLFEQILSVVKAHLRNRDMPHD